MGVGGVGGKYTWPIPSVVGDFCERDGLFRLCRLLHRVAVRFFERGERQQRERERERERQQK